MKKPEIILFCVGVVGVIMILIGGSLGSPGVSVDSSMEGWEEQGNNVYSKVLTIKEQDFLVVKTTRGVAIASLEEVE